jgi:ribosome-associated translation inhibitor RaiA
MKLRLRGDKVLVGQAARGKVELRLGLMLGRFGDEIGVVTLHLSKTSRGGRSSDKRCEISLALRPSLVRVEFTAADLSFALDRVSDMAVRSIARALRRELEINPSQAAALSRALEAARVLAADRVLATARALTPPRTKKAARVLEAARLIAANQVIATARAVKTSGESTSPRTLELARLVAAKLVLATARKLARAERHAAPR